MFFNINGCFYCPEKIGESELKMSKKTKTYDARKRLFENKNLPGWTLPWSIEENSGKYYLPLDGLYSEDPEGTATVFVKLVNSEIIARIHPDETPRIRGGPVDNETFCPITLLIDTTMPNEETARLAQRLETITFVGQYNKKLADYISKREL